MSVLLAQRPHLENQCLMFPCTLHKALLNCPFINPPFYFNLGVASVYCLLSSTPKMVLRKQNETLNSGISFIIYSRSVEEENEIWVIHGIWWHFSFLTYHW